MSNHYVCAECGSAVTKSGTGLGTWRCPKCPYYRLGSVDRYTGSGKESERKQIEPFPVRRHIEVRRKNETTA